MNEAESTNGVCDDCNLPLKQCKCEIHCHTCEDLLPRKHTCPYISSGDTTNSIVRLADAEIDEVFENGGITVTAFGQAYLQPWRFMARGNGGSAVRVLVPKFKMSTNELVWFAAQINLQKWRFFYGRMAIKSRLEKLIVATPKTRMPDVGDSLATRLVSLRDHLKELSMMLQ